MFYDSKLAHIYPCLNPILPKLVAAFACSRFLQHIWTNVFEESCTVWSQSLSLDNSQKYLMCRKSHKPRHWRSPMVGIWVYVWIGIKYSPFPVKGNHTYSTGFRICSIYFCIYLPSCDSILLQGMWLYGWKPIWL